jgi:hypothetical protein
MEGIEPELYQELRSGYKQAKRKRERKKQRNPTIWK